MSGDPLERAVNTITGLGITTRQALAPHLDTWRNRPPDDQTADDDSEVESFLTYLFQVGILAQEQFGVLVNLLGYADDVSGGDPSVGERFGEYVIQAKLGQGGMARVYRAKRADGGSQDFVLKVCDVSDEDGLRRFEREGEIMTSLSHPNIVKIHSSGRRNDSPYLVMEYVDGPTLQEVIKEKTRFPWESATRAVLQLASALGAVHVKGIVHRDVKPTNILLTRDGTVKLFDFGVARMVDLDLTSQAGQILGSPAFIAPEQWGDRKVDNRADLFAVGVIYYLLITGTIPFHGQTAAEYAVRIQNSQYIPVTTLVPEVPETVRHVIDQLLERDRRFRTPSASALIRDLSRLLEREYPDIPRLDSMQPGQSAFALVGKTEYLVGGGPGVDLWLAGGGLPDQARINRAASGFLLEPTEVQTRVNGQRIVAEVVLKDGDHLEFAPESRFIYREGNLGAGLAALTQSTEFVPEQQTVVAQPPVAVPGLLAAALENAGHPTALLCCFEALDQATSLVQQSQSRRTLEEHGMPPNDAERVTRRASYLWQQRAARVAAGLFYSTHENLGRGVEAWLSWWFEVQERHPLQVRSRRARARARLLITPPRGKPSFVDLIDGEAWTLGRNVDCDIVLSDLSISRRHARLHRLVNRYALRDLGSRQGIKHTGQRLEIGLLQLGDVVEMGRARLRLVALPDEQPEQPGQRVEVDLDTFRALVESRSPHTVEVLVDLIDPTLIERCWEASGSVGLEPQVHDTILEPYLQTQRHLALAALPAIADADFGEVEAWRAWRAAQQLPFQVAPYDWP